MPQGESSPSSVPAFRWLFAIMEQESGFFPLGQNCYFTPQTGSKNSQHTAEKTSVTLPPARPRYHPSNPVFHVPFARKGSQVIGRDKAIAKVRQQLSEGRRTAIGHTASFQGLGGLGKTHLAVEYTYQYRDSYPNGVIWLNADQDIDAQLTGAKKKIHGLQKRTRQTPLILRRSGNPLSPHRRLCPRPLGG